MKKRIIILIVIMSTILIILNRDYLNNSPFNATYYSFNFLENVYLGNANKLIIDNSGKKLSVVDPNGGLVNKFSGGSDNADFCVANQALETKDGKIYVADVKYKNASEIIERERIIEFSDLGKKVVYEKKYDSSKEPIKKGNILELKEHESSIGFIEKDVCGFSVYDIENPSLPIAVYNCSNLADASYDWDNKAAVATTKSGEVKYKTNLMNIWKDVVNQKDESNVVDNSDNSNSSIIRATVPKNNVIQARKNRVNNTLNKTSTSPSTKKQSSSNKAQIKSLQRNTSKQAAVNNYDSVDNSLDNGTILPKPEEEKNDDIPIKDEQNPWSIQIQDGKVYYTDILNNNIYHFTIENPKPSIIYNSSDLIKNLSFNQQTETLMVSSNNSFKIIRLADTTNPIVCDRAELDDYGFTISVWLLLIVSIPFYIYGLVYVLKYILSIFRKKNGFYRVMLVGICTMVVSLITSYATFANMYSNQKQEIYSSLDVCSSMLNTYIKADNIQKIKSVVEYDDKDYLATKENLDKLMIASSNSNKNYYYSLYTKDIDNIDYLIDYGETAAIGTTLDNSNKGAVYDAFEGKPITIEEKKNQHGLCAVKLVPIFDKDSNTIAVLEVGSNIEQMKSKMYSSLLDNLFSTIVTSLVITMLILEVMFALSFFEQRRLIMEQYSDSTMALPLRTLTCISYMADAMQNAFIAILLNKMYGESTILQFLPKGLAVSLPVCMQIIAMTVFMLILPKIIHNKPTNVFSMCGFTVQIVGFMFCCLLQSYGGLLLGKIFIGAGMGIVSVTVNTLAKRSNDMAFTKKAYSGISSGSLVGVTIGMGMSSILLNFGNYRLIYAFGALFLVGGLVLALQEKKYDYVPHEESNIVSTKKFVFSKKHISFSILLLIPFMMLLSYRDFFFPIYAKSKGLSETHIGQILFICGMIILYIGPSFSKGLLYKFGPKKSTIFSNILMILSIGIYVVVPNLYTIILSVIVMSMVVSFAYSCQYAYFEEMPERMAFGNTRALRVFNTMKNIGKAVGPLLYGSVVLSTDNIKGLLLIMIVTSILLIIFSLLNWIRVKEYGLSVKTK